MRKQLIETAVIVVVMAAGYRIMALVGRRGLRGLVARTTDADATGRADTLWSMARRVILVVVVISTLLLVADVWGISTTPLIAFGSVIGVALGLGVQHAVRDMIAGFFILAEDQYRIGDDVEINGVSGTVVDIRPRVTVLKDDQGSLHYLAHGTIEKTANRSRIGN